MAASRCNWCRASALHHRQPPARASALQTIANRADCENFHHGYLFFRSTSPESIKMETDIERINVCATSFAATVATWLR